MRHGNSINIIFACMFVLSSISFAEDKIISTSLLNMEKLKPSFEELEEEVEKANIKQNLKEKKKKIRIKIFPGYSNWS